MGGFKWFLLKPYHVFFFFLEIKFFYSGLVLGVYIELSKNVSKRVST